MVYFIVRILVNAVALLLTLFLLPGLGIYLPATEYVVVFVIAIFIYGAIFAFLNWLLWPPLLVLTGQFVVWTYGLFLVVINT
ncbi:MAG: phage holin family protein [Anaerolineales bacterium]|nr:phage holin family protein [Anaerolineales bacterium]